MSGENERSEYDYDRDDYGKQDELHAWRQVQTNPGDKAAQKAQQQSAEPKQESPESFQGNPEIMADEAHSSYELFKKCRHIVNFTYTKTKQRNEKTEALK